MSNGGEPTPEVSTKEKEIELLGRKTTKWLKFFIYVLSFFLILEVSSFSLIFLSHMLFSKPKNFGQFLVLPYFSEETALAPWSVYHPKFGHANRIRNTSDCGYSTDKYGFIHNGDPERDFLKAKYRIFIVGGSTVAGHGSSCNGFTISALLEKQLKADRFQDIAVVNAGVAGYYAPLEFSFVVDEILRYKPNVVISLTGTNDTHLAISGHVGEDSTGSLQSSAYYLSPYMRELQSQRKRMETVTGSLMQVAGNVGRFFERTYTYYFLGRIFEEVKSLFTGYALSTQDVGGSALLKNTIEIYGNGLSSQILDSLLHLRNSEKDFEIQSGSQGGVPSADREETLDMLSKAYARYIAAQKAVLGAVGVQFLCVYQPHLALEKKSLTKSEWISKRIMEIGFASKYKINMSENFNFFKKCAEKHFKEFGVDWSDATQVFRSATDTYWDPVHYNEKGNQVIAEFIVQNLKKNGLLPERKR